MRLDRTTLCLVLATTTALYACEPHDISLGDLPEDDSATDDDGQGVGGQGGGLGIGGASSEDVVVLAMDGPIEAVRAHGNDAYYVKWTPPSSGAASHGIWRVTTQVTSTEPMPSPELVAEISVTPNSGYTEIGFDVDATHVYFANNESDGGPGPSLREIVRFPTSGGAMETLVTEWGLIKSHMVVDSGFVYYVVDGSLKRVPSDGSGPSTAIGEVGMDHDQGHVVFALTGSDVVFCEPTGGIYRTPAAGGSLQLIATAPGPFTGCTGVTLSNDHVFWSTRDENDFELGYVFSAPLASSGQTTGELVAAVGTPHALRYHDGALYYLAGSDAGVLTELDPVTGVETALVPHVSFYANLAFDAIGPSLVVQQGQYSLLKVTP